MLNLHALTRSRSLILALACGVASAWLVLVPTYTSMRDSYPEWLPLVVWSLGPFLTALVFTTRHPDEAWKLVTCIEGGVIAGIVVDLCMRSYLGIPSTVWPFAIVLVIFVSFPPVLVGAWLGRKRANARQTTSHR